jgi:hypothetical protein
VSFSAAAHAEGIAVREVFRDIALIGKRDVRAFSAEAYAVTVIFLEAVWDQAISSVLTATDNSEQHRIPPNGLWPVTQLWVNAATAARASCKQTCGSLRKAEEK